MKFTVHEKQMKAQLGAAYNLANYTEGVDYRRQKTGFGSRVIFRANILGLSDAQVPVKCDLSDITAVKNDLNETSTNLSEQDAGITSVTIVDPSLVEHKQDKTPVMIRPAVLDGVVRTARVVKRYPNGRWVETDLCGRVFVGGKGGQIRLGQILQVKNGELYLR